jgi:two-component system sensor histidine kinase HydH
MPPPRERALEPPNEAERRQRRPDQDRPGTLFFNTLTQGKYFYIDVLHSGYWRTLTLSAILFPLCEILILVLVFYIRRLYLRNREYRERIEAQQNLVVLGTAASTLAHEIKNPLLSIRLQTGILEKLIPENGKDEILHINQEVDRLSALTYRVNDYLREAAGKPEPVNIRELLEESSRRLCGRSVIQDNSAGDAFILADPERIRSVLENILRNALEAGGDEKEIGASIRRSHLSLRAANGQGSLIINIFDRGTGIPAGDLKRVFDPFFTGKSTGTGIGLSISKRFVEAAGGSITLENREAGGLMASIVIPEYTGSSGN